MKPISAQVSLYPLRQSELAPAIARAVQAFRARGLEVKPGAMSTLVTGEAEAVFDALEASFQSAADLGDVVMVVSLSNCCPAADA
jgi:uncharacterized protein YqgV (UPF0045/DUF77 family)